MAHHYTLHALDLPGVLSLSALNSFHINNHGLIAGSVLQGEQRISFIIDGTQFQSLPQLSPYSATVTGINDTGTIVGNIPRNRKAGIPACGFILTAYELTILENQEPGTGSAIAINNHDDVLLQYNGDTAYIYTERRFVPLDPTKHYHLQANAMNDDGVLAGVGYVRNQPARSGGAFVYQHGHIAFLPKLELGSVNKRMSVATAINNRGVIVGRSLSDAGLQHAFVYEDHTLYDLGNIGSLTSTAVAINNHGVIVGYSDHPGNPHADVAQALLWRQRACVNLNDFACSTGWNLIAATDINDAGAIVGLGRLHGELRAFLMTPQ